MKHIQLVQLTLIISFFVLIVSCQEENDVVEIVQEDQDVLAAIKLADEYLSKEKARFGDQKSIVVLKYKDDQLLYATTRDNYKSYQVLEEQSVTALAKPGEYVFWYSGGGVTDLEGIEFDATSQAFLDNLPDEINADKMWVIRVPETYDTSNEYLKYDIVYDFEGNTGAPIRLDPKLQIGN